MPQSISMNELPFPGFCFKKENKNVYQVFAKPKNLNNLTIQSYPKTLLSLRHFF